MAVATCLYDCRQLPFHDAGRLLCAHRPIAGGSRIEHPVRFVAKRLFSSLPFDTYLLIIVLSVAGVRLPSELVAFTEPIANANSFLAMFMLGLMMSFSVSRERMAKVARLVGLRAAFSVVLTCIVWLALPVDDVMRALLTLLVWSPGKRACAYVYPDVGGDGGLPASRTPSPSSLA